MPVHTTLLISLFAACGVKESCCSQFPPILWAQKSESSGSVVSTFPHQLLSTLFFRLFNI